MGIRKREVFVVVCDVCLDLLQNGKGATLHLYTKDEVKEHLDSAGWTKKDGKVACENCYEKI